MTQVFYFPLSSSCDLRMVVREPLETKSEWRGQIREIHRVVSSHFSQLDPMGWAVCYDPLVKEVHVFRISGAASLLDRYNGNYVRMRNEHRTSWFEIERIEKICAEMEIQGRFDLSCVARMSRSFPASRLSTPFKELYTIFNNASIQLREEAPFRDTFLAPMQWRDLLHPKRMLYGEARPVAKEYAKRVLLELAKNPKSKERDEILLKQWLFEIARRSKREAGERSVYWLISSLDGFYQNIHSQKIIINETKLF